LAFPFPFGANGEGDTDGSTESITLNKNYSIKTQDARKDGPPNIRQIVDSLTMFVDQQFEGCGSGI
jgi:hypothetical protein